MGSAADATAPPLARTRFRVPHQVGEFVKRRRLLTVLRGGEEARLTLIHGPAGFGKTTLADQWRRTLESTGTTVAWLTIDRDDNNPVWLLAHIIQAIRRVEPSIAVDLIQTLETHSEHVERYVLTELVNELDDWGDTFVLMLDDWHLVTVPRAVEVLVTLIDAAPGNVRLVLTSRTRSTLPLERLRVRNQLVEIDAEALRFDAGESEAFLLDINGLTLHPDDVHRLQTSTDGWVAALQLVTLSLRGRPDPGELIRGFSGRHQSIGDYLAENVLDALPPDILDFLLTTSICERLSGELAGVLSGRSDGGAILEDLERRDLFLRPLDEERTWFRYHHLFADHLRRRLERDDPLRITGLHRTAAAWLAAHHHLSEAVEHALLAGEEDLAVEMVEADAMHLVEHSRMATLLGLVDKLPRDRLNGRPHLQLAIAWAHCLLQRGADAQSALDLVLHALSDLAEPPPDAAEAEEMRGEARVVQACIDIYADDISRAEALVEPCLAHAERYRAWTVAVAANIQSFVDIQSRHFDTALRRQAWATPFHDRTAGPFSGVYGQCFAGIAAAALLDLDSSAAHLRSALRLARDSAGHGSHAAQLAAALLGELCYERGDLDEAERLLGDSRRLGGEGGVADFMLATFAAAARLQHLLGRTAEAVSLLDEGDRVAERLGLRRLAARLIDERVRILLDTGDLTGAVRLIPPSSVHDMAADTNDRAAHERQIITQGRVLIASGRAPSAVTELTALLSSIQMSDARSKVTVRVQLAVAHLAAGQEDLAATVLVPALVEGERAGLVRGILDGGPLIERILTALRGRPRDARTSGTVTVGRGYIDRLLSWRTPVFLSTIARTSPSTQGDAWAPHADTRLTAREQEILPLLAEGWANKEIARELGLGVNTVKWYLKGLFSKLDVSRRQECVAEARRRGLLV